MAIRMATPFFKFVTSGGAAVYTPRDDRGDAVRGRTRMHQARAGQNRTMASLTSDRGHLDHRSDARPNANAAGLAGLVARGLLYLVLAALALGLLLGTASEQVDTRGALHELGSRPAGKVVLGLLALGFAGFALWHVYVALRGSGREESKDRLADFARAVVYGALSGLSVSFLAAPKPSGNTDRAGQTWTAKLLESGGGQLLVGAVGALVIGVGVWLVWRAFSGGPQDEHAVLEAAPLETEGLHRLAAVGNVARGGVVALVGLFVVIAAVEFDPNETVGLDGALKRLLDEPYGEVLILLVAAGLAAFGTYSIARAWVNRRESRS
jgi:hypothetical protein